MKDAIRKAEALIEALPYIRTFSGKTFVIKLGGAAMVKREMLDSLVEDLVFLATVGIRPVLVHGGGPLISARMEGRGLRPTFVQGHRVTDGDALEIVRQVMREINNDLVHRLRLLEALAEGVVGEPLGAISAARKILRESRPDGTPKEYELGLVGNVERVDVGFFRGLIERNVIPVVAPLAQGREGELLNCNADSVAAFLGAALAAEKAVFLTDTPGILMNPKDPGSLVSSLTEDHVGKLIKEGVISGGMLPKVSACLTALDGGVGKAHIVDGRVPHSVLLEIFTDRGAGTQILK